ncbi:MAG: hypothetical protein PHF00_14095, partial [Elusimicrobia bacterium]|nr:hypothetical protein [Elusimicrobiota bacterium]
MEQERPDNVQIPVLKKEEKERKGAGVALPSAASKTASTWGFAGLMGGKAGVALLACALGGAGLIGYGVLQQGQVRRAGSDPQLAAPDMSVRVGMRDSQGSKSLAYISKAGEGQIKWDDPNAVRAAAKAEDAKPEEAKPEGDETDAAKAKEGEGLPQTPDHFTDTRKLGGLSGAKLSSQLGNRFGGGNVFKGSGFAPKQSQLDGKLKNLTDFRQ